MEQYANYIRYGRHTESAATSMGLTQACPNYFVNFCLVLIVITATVRLPPEAYIHTYIYTYVHTTQNILTYGHVAALHVFADGRQSSKYNFNPKLQKLSQVHTFLHLTKTVTHLILSGLVTSTCTRCLLLTKPGAN